MFSVSSLFSIAHYIKNNFTKSVFVTFACSGMDNTSAEIKLLAVENEGTTSLGTT